MSNRIQEWREVRGLTLRDLAAQVGTSNQQISHLELGKRHLTTDWLIRLACVLECHPWELVADDGPAALTAQEQRLLQIFRRMTTEQQDSLLAGTALQQSPSGVRKRRVSLSKTL